MPSRSPFIMNTDRSFGSFARCKWADRCVSLAANRATVLAACCWIYICVFFFWEGIQLWYKIIQWQCSLNPAPCLLFGPQHTHFRALVSRGFDGLPVSRVRGIPSRFTFRVLEYSFSPFSSSSIPSATNSRPLHPFLSYFLTLVGNCSISIFRSSDKLIQSKC